MRELREKLRKEIIAWESGGTAYHSAIDELNGLMADHPMRTKGLAGSVSVKVSGVKTIAARVAKSFADLPAVLLFFYAAVVKRDIGAARGYLADDLVFVGLFETYRSANEYVAALTGLLQVTVRLDVKKIVAEENDAAVFFELETKAPAAGTVLVAEWHQFKNGKITQVASAFDGRPYAAMFSGKAGA
jgi:hypothetical protein